MSNRNSLEILQKRPQTNVLVNEPISAANVALPESTEASSQQSQCEISEASDYQTSEAYLDDINHLQEHMPHIKNVGRKSRGHDDAQFASFDYSGSEMISNKIHKIGSNGSLIVEEFAATVLDDVPAHTDTRLLAIDDLSPKLIYILCTCLPISLEFFEEHLLNAGWQNNHYEDMSPATFNTTADFAKDYVSVRWLRPIRARNLCPNGEHQSQKTLEPSATPDTWEEQLSEQKHIEHSTRPLVNILRLPWEASLGSRDFSAWEERASVWSTQHGQCRFIILLLDPLPTIGHTMTIKRTEPLSQGPREVRSRRRKRSELCDPEHGRQHRAGVEATQSMDLQDVSRLHESTQRCSHEYI
ncbi:MAG: hypothetical protein Q9204_007481, partial [Flavoplaca sp. TL-2023a]